MSDKKHDPPIHPPLSPETEITDELKESFLSYSMSVIVDRALPDVRDGLKPVHRRILWAMWDSGLNASAKLRKSANVVGEVLGRYHPHGDSAVYDTMARMAQDFSLRYPLILGQGNWGCFTKDTKVKLTDGRSLSFSELIQEHKEGKKNYTFTFDNQTQKIAIAEIKNPRRTRRLAELIKVTLDNGDKIECTPNHKFMLRDGTYLPAENLKSGNSLMPGYTRLSDIKDNPKVVGYSMIHQPVSGYWDFIHYLSDAWNLKNKKYLPSAGRVRHHQDFNKENNNPDNIARLGWKEHWLLHSRLAGWRYQNDPQFVKKLTSGRNKYIKENPEVFSIRAKNLNKILWQDENFRKKIVGQLKKKWQDKEYKEKMITAASKRLKEKWQNEEFRNLISALKSEEMKKRWQDPVYRSFWSQKMKEISAKIWSNPKHREHMAILMKKRIQDPKWLEQRSKTSKELWQNPEFIKKYPPDHFSKMAKKLWQNESVKEFHRQKIKQQWQSEDFRKKISESVKKRNAEYLKEHPEHIKVMSEKSAISLRNKWQSPDYKDQVIRSKILRHAHNLLAKYDSLTPDIYEQERTPNGTPAINKALPYFSSFENLIAEAKIYNHSVVSVEFIDKREDVYDLTVDGTHNFLLAAGIFVHNSIDGDRPAAMRYTECKMTRVAEEMLRDISKDTVNWKPNYDGARLEPKVLPSALPNLLVNGSMGIAVGMATAIPPHNLNEVIDAITHCIDHPAASSHDLLQFIKGPDFPTGGVIYDKKAIAEAYTTGRGAITTRAVAEIVPRGGKESSASREAFDIVITAIPYLVNKSDLIQKIASLVIDKKIDGVKDVRDESDKDGLRIVIEVKNDAPPQKILNQLWKYTDLQKNFNLNIVALAGGLEPQTMSLKDLVFNFIAHRKEAVTRRSRFDLARAKERAHILEGLSKALDNIDAVITTIKKSANRADAAANLKKKFGFSDAQTTAILEMRLQSLAALERRQIEDELKAKRALIKELETLLKSEAKIFGVVKEELSDLRARFGDERRTRVVAGAVGELSDEDLIPDEESIITLSAGGYIKRLPPATFKSQRRGGRGLIGGGDLGEEDMVSEFLGGSTHDNILFFTNQGKVFQTKVYEIPAASRTSKGKAIHNFLNIPASDHVSAIVVYPSNTASASNQYLVMATRSGIIKKTPLSDFTHVRQNGIIAINLKGGDLLEWVELSSGKSDVVLTTSSGQSIRFRESDVRSIGRSSTGVIAIHLKKDDRVSSMNVVGGDAAKTGRLLVVMENGYGKQTPLSEYKVQKRGGSGIRTAHVTPKTGRVVVAKIITDQEELFALSAKGQIIKTEINTIRTAGRSTQGVKVMNVRAGDKIAGIVCL